jgi:hypothetical protein
VSANVDVWVAAPAEVPVSVRLTVPSVAPTAAVTVSVEAVPVVVDGDREMVTPAGAPTMVSAISPVRFERVNATLLVPVVPCATVSVVGENACVNEKAVTVSVNVAETSIAPGPLALTEMG